MAFTPMKEQLSPAWTAKLFKLLHEKYGSAFDGDPDEWSKTLAGVSGESIKRGLSKCQPDSIPSAEVFRDLCKPDPVQVPSVRVGNKEWANKLKQRYLAGEKLSIIQISYAEAVVGKFSSFIER